MNIILGLISILICFTGMVFVEKFFKKEGLYVWIAIAVITANIFACKQVNLAGFAVSLGSILFGSSFLATDILTIKYSKDDAKKGVIFGLLAIVIFNIIMQVGMLFIPNDLDFVQGSLRTIFDFNLRVSGASIIMYFIANLADVYLFDKLMKIFPDKMWLSNNVATIICNCLENFLFGLLAFGGIFAVGTIFQMSILGSIIEIIIALCDTPFLYLSRKLK